MRRLHAPEDLEGIDDQALRGVIGQRFAELAGHDDFSFEELAEFWVDPWHRQSPPWQPGE